MPPGRSAAARPTEPLPPLRGVRRLARGVPSAAALVLALLGGCAGDDGTTAGDGTGSGGADLCGHGPAPAVEIGRSIGSSFTPYQPGEEVEILVAPQGGFGVPVSIRTEGLLAGVDATGATYGADVELSLGRGGTSEGTFYDAGPLGCISPREGGLLSGLVAAFDPSVVSTNEQLLALDGQQATVRVVVTDSGGVSAEGSQVVTLRVGGG